ISRPIVITIVKEKTSWINIPVCLQSEPCKMQGLLFFFLTLSFPIINCVIVSVYLLDLNFCFLKQT
ncbi:hypothetical protein, partial [Streptococcus dysgalactiae]|uniref:hypothetical protein n=1 Tax=Streptococcus dysgalactiae TaxID=1334 RepID=UPI003DA1B080